MIKNHPVLSLVFGFFFAWALVGASPIATLAKFVPIFSLDFLPDRMLSAQVVSTIPNLSITNVGRFPYATPSGLKLEVLSNKNFSPAEDLVYRAVPLCGDPKFPIYEAKTPAGLGGFAAGQKNDLTLTPVGDLGDDPKHCLYRFIVDATNSLQESNEGDNTREETLYFDYMDAQQSGAVQSIPESFPVSVPNAVIDYETVIEPVNASLGLPTFRASSVTCQAGRSDFKPDRLNINFDLKIRSLSVRDQSITQATGQAGVFNPQTTPQKNTIHSIVIGLGGENAGECSARLTPTPANYAFAKVSNADRYEYRIVFDPQNAKGEIDETNNTAAFALTRMGTPDPISGQARDAGQELRVQNFTKFVDASKASLNIPITVFPGPAPEIEPARPTLPDFIIEHVSLVGATNTNPLLTPRSLQIGIRNQGKNDSSIFTLRAEPFTNNASSSLPSFTATSTFAGGFKTKTVTIRNTSPSLIAATGTHQYRARIDSTNAVLEMNELNNNFAFLLNLGGIRNTITSQGIETAAQTTGSNTSNSSDVSNASTSLSGGSGTFGACPNLTRNLSAESRDASTGGEVTKLQQYLSGTTINGVVIYPTAEVTGFFGPRTEAAVERFQSLMGIVNSGTPETTGYGFVGPMTRAAMNANCSGVFSSSISGGTGSSVGFIDPASNNNLNTNNGNQTESASQTPAQFASATGQPDLVVTGINPGTAQAGKAPTLLRAQIENRGGPLSGTAFTITATPSGSGPVLPTYRGITNLIGQVILSSLTPTISVSSGSYDYTASVDTNSNIQESNEANNQTPFKLNIGATGATASGISAPPPQHSCPVSSSMKIFGADGRYVSPNPQFIVNGARISHAGSQIGTISQTCRSNGVTASVPKYEVLHSRCDNGTLTRVNADGPLVRGAIDQGIGAEIDRLCPNEGRGPEYKVTPVSSATIINQTSDTSGSKTNYYFGCVGEDDSIEFDLELLNTGGDQPFDPVTWEVNTLTKYLQSTLDNNFSKEIQDQLRERGVIGNPGNPEATINITPQAGRKIRVRYTVPRGTEGVPIYDPQIISKYLQQSRSPLVTGNLQNQTLFVVKRGTAPFHPDVTGFANGDNAIITYGAGIPRITTEASNCSREIISLNAEPGTDHRFPIPSSGYQLIKRPGSTISWRLTYIPNPTGQALGVPSAETTTLPNWITLDSQTGDSNFININGLNTRTLTVAGKEHGFNLYIKDNVTNTEKKHTLYVNFNQGFGSNNSANIGPRLTPTQLQLGVQTYYNTVFLLKDWVGGPSSGVYNDNMLSGITANRLQTTGIPGLRNVRTFLDTQQFLPNFEPKSTFLYSKRWTGTFSAEATTASQETARILPAFQPILNNLPGTFNEHYGSIDFRKYGKYEFVARSYAQDSLRSFATINYALPTVDLLQRRVDQFMTAGIPQILTLQVYSTNDNTKTALVLQQYPDLRANQDVIDYFNVIRYRNNLTTGANLINNDTVFTWNKFGGTGANSTNGTINSQIDSSILNLVGSANSTVLPDYQIVIARGESALGAGTGIAGYVTVRNGGGNLNNNKVVSISLIPPAPSQIGGLQLPTLNGVISSPIQPGETRETSIHGTTLPSEIPNAGLYTFIAKVDGGNNAQSGVLEESSETNNEFTVKIFIPQKGTQTGTLSPSEYYMPSSGPGTTSSTGSLETVRNKLSTPVPSIGSVLTNFNTCDFGRSVYSLIFNQVLYPSNNPCSPQTIGGANAVDQFVYQGAVGSVGDAFDSYPLRKIGELRGIETSPSPTGYDTNQVPKVPLNHRGFRYNLLTGEITFDPSKATPLLQNLARQKGITGAISLGNIAQSRRLTSTEYNTLVTDIQNFKATAHIGSSQTEFDHLLSDPDRNQPSGLPLWGTFESRFAEGGPSAQGVSEKLNPSNTDAFPWIKRPWLQYWFFGGEPSAFGSARSGPSIFDLYRQMDAGIIPQGDITTHPLLGRITVQMVKQFERWVFDYMPAGKIRNNLNCQLSNADRAAVNEILIRLGGNFGTPSPLAACAGAAGAPDYVPTSVSFLPTILSPLQTLPQITAIFQNIGGNDSTGTNLTFTARPTSNTALPIFNAGGPGDSFGFVSGAARQVPLLSANPSYQFPVGNHSYELKIDSPNVTEANESNNILNFTIPVQQAGTIPTGVGTGVGSVSTTIVIKRVGEDLKSSTAPAGSIQVGTGSPVSGTDAEATVTIGSGSSVRVAVSDSSNKNEKFATCNYQTGSAQCTITNLALYQRAICEGGYCFVNITPIQGQNTKVVFLYENPTTISGETQTVNPAINTGASALAQPDLSIDSITLDNPNPQANQPVSLNVTVRNSGGALLQPFMIYALDTTNNVGFGQTFQAFLGQIASFRIISPMLSPKSYLFNVTADYGRTVTELNETNNSRNVSVTVNSLSGVNPICNYLPQAGGIRSLGTKATQTECANSCFAQRSVAGTYSPTNTNLDFCTYGGAAIFFVPTGQTSLNTTPSTGVVSTGGTITATNIASQNFLNFGETQWRAKGWLPIVEVAPTNYSSADNFRTEEVNLGGDNGTATKTIYLSQTTNQLDIYGRPVPYNLKYPRSVFPYITYYDWYIRSTDTSKFPTPYTNNTALNLGGTNQTNISSSNDQLKMAVTDTASQVAGIAVGQYIATNSFEVAAIANQLVGLGLGELGVDALGEALTGFAGGGAGLVVTLLRLPDMLSNRSYPGYSADVTISNGQASVINVFQLDGGNAEAGQFLAQTAARAINFIKTTKNATLQNGWAGRLGDWPRRGGFFSQIEGTDIGGTPTDWTKAKFFVAPEFAVFMLTVEILAKNNINLTNTEASALYEKIKGEFNEFRKYQESASIFYGYEAVLNASNTR